MLRWLLPVCATPCLRRTLRPVSRACCRSRPAPAPVRGHGPAPSHTALRTAAAATPVFDTDRCGRQHRALHQAVAFQPLQRVGQRLVGNTVKPAHDLVELRWPGAQHRQDQDRPFVADLLEDRPRPPRVDQRLVDLPLRRPEGWVCAGSRVFGGAGHGILLYICFRSGAYSNSRCWAASTRTCLTARSG